MTKSFKATAVWLKVVGVLAPLTGAPLVVSGCYPSQPPRDTNYGTNLGSDFVPPDASVAATGGATGSDGGAVSETSAVYDSSVESPRADSSLADRGAVVQTPCTPDCTGVMCGASDGCGGTCNIGCVCVPNCAGLVCGSSDGCGGFCTLGCFCIPSCGPLDCGTYDGCGGMCTLGCFCTPSCGGNECGTSDGCGGFCTDGCFCSPSCWAFDCGTSDGCGGTCNDGC